jgi:hypothetical protein
LFYTKCFWISYFFQIFTFIGSSVICFSLSEIPKWTHQREFRLRCISSVVDTRGKWKKSSIIKVLIILFGHLWEVELAFRYILPSSSLKGLSSLILFPVFATGVIDIGLSTKQAKLVAKFAAGVINTRGEP